MARGLGVTPFDGSSDGRTGSSPQQQPEWRRQGWTIAPRSTGTALARSLASPGSASSPVPVRASRRSRERLLRFLTQQASPWAYVIVGGLAALDASAFVGLFIPGELALLAGGYVVQQGHASLPAMLLAATLGAVVGDSIGYEVGRHLGPRLHHSHLGRRIGDERWDRAHDLLQRRGGPAIFLGRFVGLLRALVPAVAGTSRMPYRRFLLWNALGGLIWAPGMVLLGYSAGSSYGRIERYAGRASLILLLLAVLIGGLLWGSRWVSRHQADMFKFVRQQADRPQVARLSRRYRHQLDFLAARLDPGGALGLTLTVTLAALVAAAWAFSALSTSVLFDQDLARPDQATLTFMVAHRADWLTTVLRVVTLLGGGRILIPASVLVAALWRYRRADWSAAWLLGLSYLGAYLLVDLTKRLTHRARPPAHLAVVHADGYAFPSGHATQSVAVWGAMAFLTASAVTTWPRRVAAWTLALLIAGLVGFSRLYLGVHWLSDIAAGWAVGALWLFSLIAGFQFLATTDHGRTDRRPPSPHRMRSGLGS